MPGIIFSCHNMYSYSFNLPMGTYFNSEGRTLPFITNYENGGYVVFSQKYFYHLIFILF